MTRKFAAGSDEISARASWFGVSLYAFFLIAATTAFSGYVPRKQTDFASRVDGAGNPIIPLAEHHPIDCSASPTVPQVLPELGDLSRFGVMTLGTNGLQMSGSAMVTGDVEVAGSGTIAMSGYARIDGDFYRRGGSTVLMWSTATIAGKHYYNRNTELDNDRTRALGISARAFALKPTRPYTNITLGQNQSTSFSGAPGATVVLKLGNFTLNGNASLTLQGTATTTFVINVTKQFSLAGTSKIVLSGGVTWNNVLFNITGTGADVTVSGSAVLQGIVMANARTVKLSGHAEAIGAVIANRVIMSDASRVVHLPVASP